MPRALIPALIFVALVGFFFRGLSLNPREVPSPFIDKPAPGFVLPALQDPTKTVSAELWAGRAALVNVWATWCAGCLEEHAFLVELAGQTDLPIIGLDWKDERAKAEAWLKQLGNPYTAVGFDEEGRTAIDWGVYGAPETFLIGPDGVIRHKHLGPLNAEIWQRDFVPVIATFGVGGGS